MLDSANSTALKGHLNKLRDHTFLIEVLSFVFPAVSAIATYDGLDMLTGNGFWAFLGAVVAFLFIAAFYRLYLLKYPTAKPKDRKQLVMPMIVFGFFAMALTTPFSVTSFGGNVAIREDMNSTIREGELRFNEHLAALREEQSLAGSLGQYAQQFSDLSKQETAGAFTGTAGHGSAAITFETVGQSLTRMREQVEANKEPVDGFKVESKAIFDDLRATTYARISQQEKQARFAAGLNNLNDLLNRMVAASVVPSVQQAAGSLNVVAELQAGQDGSALGARQSQAIEKAQTLVHSAQRDINRAAISVKATNDKQMAPLTVIDQGQAIFVYWLSIPWAWALAIALDFSPLLFLFILSRVNDQGSRSRSKKGDGRTESSVAIFRSGK